MALTKEQLKIRRRGVGSSEIAAVAGLNPWSSAADVWANKLQLVPDFEGNRKTKKGEVLERLIREWTEEDLDVVILCPDTKFHPKHRRILATADGLIYKGERISDNEAQLENADILGVFEAKNVGWRVKHHWEQPEEMADGIPQYVLPQVIWEMAVHSADTCHVSAMIDGEEDLFHYDIPFDKDLFGYLVERVDWFWQYVEHRVPPPVDGSEAAAQWIAKHYRKADNDVLINVAGEQERILYDQVETYIEAGKDEKEAEGRKEAAAAHLKDFIKSSHGIQGDGWKVVWKNDKDKHKVRWDNLVESLQITEEQLKEHTETKPGNRVLRVKPRKE